MASFGQDEVVDEPPVIVDGRDGAPLSVGIIQVVVNDDPEYRKKAQKVTQKASYFLKYFTSLMGPMRPASAQKMP